MQQGPWNVMCRMPRSFPAPRDGIFTIGAGTLRRGAQCRGHHWAVRVVLGFLRESYRAANDMPSASHVPGLGCA